MPFIRRQRSRFERILNNLDGFGDGDVLSGWRTQGFECIQCMSLELLKIGSLAISLWVSPVLSFARKLKALKDNLKHGLERYLTLFPFIKFVSWSELAFRIVRVGWHSCFNCQKASKFQCYVCPKAVCGSCLSVSEFAQVRGKKGFCSHCLKLALLIEMRWMLTLMGARKCPFCRCPIKERDTSGCVRRKSSVKGKATPLKREFIGWGSKVLIEFLASIGQDTTQKLSQYDVTSIISRYVNDNNLLHPQKKRKVLCDERLRPVLGRKSVNKNKIYDIVEGHLAENLEESEDDEARYSSEDKDETVLMASYSPKNIKLIYLKRSLMLELLKQPDTFESKVKGSFVKVKADSYWKDLIGLVMGPIGSGEFNVLLGRVESLYQGAGGFIRLGVSDVEGKRFCIFVPRGRRDKRGWTIMAEKLKQVKGEKRGVRSFKKEIETLCCGELERWTRGEDDIEKWGKFWAKSWDLKEARRVVPLGAARGKERMLGRGGREKGRLGKDCWAPNFVLEPRNSEESGGCMWWFYHRR
ncbi:Uncharacterized protein CK203_023776 [Vitis vinifera]|uniref:DM2 domain-containing protein n=1 Tax=Vitis vinifera TaxID=29760 RepID=A0A438J9V7_VITVI|nr:Uncharacterized protein CK203_023776 [Vitis vinifera]